ncbi:MAG: hypothetical protein E7355_04070 [Clostridiales bacterium]|nr:hypothetical protein [Clostridiales bacterium]
MNVTFLIGNGFDIGIGMKTRYGDFYSEYIKLKIDNENILEFQKEIQDNIKDWADFEEAFGKHSESFEANEADKYLQQYEHFFEYFLEYLKKEEKNFEMPEELEVIKIMERALTNYYKKLQSQDRESIEDFYKWFGNNITYTFISFNYTSILDAFVNIFKNYLKREQRPEIIMPTIHVHGLLEKYMIIGVNDKSQITNKDLSENPEVLAEIVKPIINKGLKMGYDTKATKAINQSDIICVYGMSLGATDCKWWELLAKWLSANTSKKLIILNYQPDCDIARPYTWLRAKNKIINKFLGYGTLTDSQKEKLDNQICVGINQNIFSYKKPKRKKSVIQHIENKNSTEIELQQKSMKLLTEIVERTKQNSK